MTAITYINILVNNKICLYSYVTHTKLQNVCYSISVRHIHTESLNVKFFFMPTSCTYLILNRVIRNKDSPRVLILE